MDSSGLRRPEPVQRRLHRCDFLIRLPFGPGLAEPPHNFRLPVRRHLAVADKGCSFAFMSEILAPRLPFFRRAANPLPVQHKSIPERVRIGVGQTRRRKSCAKDTPDRLGRSPMLAG